MANNKNRINDFRLPAEWEQQSGVQLTWPHANTDWKPYLEEITKVFIDMAKVITNEELLVVVTPEIDAVKNKFDCFVFLLYCAYMLYGTGFMLKPLFNR